MASKTRKKVGGCDELQELYDNGDVILEELTSTTHGGPGAKTSKLFLAKISSSIGKSPCDYLPKGNSSCRLITKNVPESGKTWDYYLMHCHNGPPCDFFEDL
jgi:hypothetical protein